MPPRYHFNLSLCGKFGLTRPQRRCPRAGIAALLVAACAAIAAAPPAAAEVTDDLQRTVAPARPAGRVVSLAPHLTELVHSAGAGGKLVGVSRHCDYPPSVEQLPAVSDYATINYELITELQPDLVLVWSAGLKDTDLRKLVSLYRNVYVSSPADFKGIAENLTDIGALTGNAAHARRAAAAFLRDISDIAEHYARPRPVRTLYLLWHEPPMTVGGNHWISRAIHLCGGVNVFSDAIADVVQINRESLRLTRADVVLHSLENYKEPGRSPALAETFGTADTTPVFYIEDDLIQRPSLRLSQSTAQLCRVIHRAGGD